LRTALTIELLGFGLAMAAALSDVSLHAAKPAPPPPPNWACTITFHDTLSYTDPVTGLGQSIPTAMQGDGSAPYVDGVDGGQCHVVQNPTSGLYQYLFVNASDSSPRYFWMPGQIALTAYTRTGYGDFENRQPGYFDITQIATVVSPSTTEHRRIRVGVGYALDFNGGLMFGNSLSSDPLMAGSASAWITARTFNGAGGVCSWEVRFYPYAALEAGDTGAIAGTRYLSLQEGNPAKRRRTADFAMPISATVQLKSGSNGCP